MTRLYVWVATSLSVTLYAAAFRDMTLAEWCSAVYFSGIALGIHWASEKLAHHIDGELT